MPGHHVCLESSGPGGELGGQANAEGGRSVEVERVCYGGIRKRMAMAELVHSRKGCARRLAMQNDFFGYAGGSGADAGMRATAEFMTRLTAFCIRQAALQGRAAPAADVRQLFGFSRPPPQQPDAQHQQHHSRMAAIGSLVFCTDCGNLLDGSAGKQKVVLTCTVCGANCKGRRIPQQTLFEEHALTERLQTRPPRPSSPPPSQQPSRRLCAQSGQRCRLSRKTM